MLLTRAPLYSGCPFLVRLACVKRAASVDSEPGSNSRLNRLEESDESDPYRCFRSLRFELRLLTNKTYATPCGVRARHFYFASNQIVKDLRRQADDPEKVNLLPASKAVQDRTDLHPAIVWIRAQRRKTLRRSLPPTAQTVETTSRKLGGSERTTLNAHCAEKHRAAQLQKGGLLPASPYVRQHKRPTHYVLPSINLPKVMGLRKGELKVFCGLR